MFFNWGYRRISELQFAISALLAINSFVSCLDAEFSSGHHQRILQGLHVTTSASPALNVVQVPLQRRFIKFQGRYYFLNASIGSPEQSLELLVDTGSTDTWVYDSSYCAGSSRDIHSSCYDPKKSNTSDVIPAPPVFQARYGRVRVEGVYVQDDFVLGTGKLEHARFGMVHEGDGPPRGGLMGLGFDTAEFAPNNSFGYLYPDILDSLYNYSVIDSRAFGLYLNNGSVAEKEARGSLVLGGYDRSKFTEPLVSFAITSPNDVQRVGVPLTAISAIIAGASVPIWVAAGSPGSDGPSVPAVLDSGDMFTQMPPQAHTKLVEQLNRYKDGIVNDVQPGGKFDPSMHCSHSSANVSINFTFSNPDTTITISVPFSELVLPAPWTDDCVFALQPKAKNPDRPYWLNFGSSVVNSMYLVVEYDKNNIRIAKARYDGHKADIVPINHR